MNSFVVALCLFAVAGAASVPSVSSNDKDAKVLRSSFEQIPSGGYQYSFENDNGIAAQASAVVKSLGKDENALEVTGSNQYKAPDGSVIALNYIANENGYQPQGAHLPTTPAPQPIPDYILRSLEFIKAHPYVEKKL